MIFPDECAYSFRNPAKRCCFPSFINEIIFNKADITKEDSSEHHESEKESDGENFKLISDSIDKEISIAVINH